MRKIIASILLATALMMGMTTTALAAEATASAASAETFEWSYVNAEGKDREVWPANELTFGVEADASNPDAEPKLTVSMLKVLANPTTMTVNVPSYDTIGEYVYTVTPTSSNSGGYPILGVTYKPFQVRVLVTLDEDRAKMVSTAYLTDVNGNKIDGINNPYGLGTLTITQKVTGNYGDPDKEFSMVVQLNASYPNTVKNDITYIVGGTKYVLEASEWSADSYKGVRINLKDGQQAVFTNLPERMTYNINVDDYSGSGYSAATVEYSDGNRGSVADGDADTATVTIGRTAAIPTGVFLDNMPIVMAAAVAIAGAIALFALKRRRANR